MKTMTTALHFIALELPLQLQIKLLLQLHCPASNHCSIHQLICCAIHDCQQRTSPISFLSLKLPPPPCAVHTGMKSFFLSRTHVHIPRFTFFMSATHSSYIRFSMETQLRSFFSAHRLVLRSQSVRGEFPKAKSLWLHELKSHNCWLSPSLFGARS